MTALTDWSKDGDNTHEEREDDDEVPDHVHPECVDVCAALEFGACCRYPSTPRTGRIGAMVEKLTRDGLPDQASRALGPLARAATVVAGLDLAGLPDQELFQLACLFGRAWSVIDCAGGGDDLDRQAEIIGHPCELIWGELRERHRRKSDQP